MEQQNLRDLLEKLHKQLEGTECVDDVSKDALRDLVHDIDRILQLPEGPPSEHHETLLAKLKDSTRHFEASYPDLTTIMHRAIDTLTNMGI